MFHDTPNEMHDPRRMGGVSGWERGLFSTGPAVEVLAPSLLGDAFRALLAGCDGLRLLQPERGVGEVAVALGTGWSTRLAAWIRANSQDRAARAVLVTPLDLLTLRQAVGMGVRSFVEEGSDVTNLRNACLAAARGEAYCSLAVARLLPEAVHLNRPCGLLARLTQRERQVAELVAKGFTNQEIAVAMCVTTDTIKYYLKHIFQTLQIDDRRTLAHVVDQAALLKSASAAPTCPPLPQPDGPYFTYAPSQVSEQIAVPAVTSSWSF